MSNVFNAAWVIARRDFVATVWSRTFLLFLLAPIIALGFGVMIGVMTEEADIQARHPNVAVVMGTEDAKAVEAAHRRIADAVGTIRLPEMKLVDPEDDAARQAERLLASPDRNITAVLSGTLERPVLTGPRTVTNMIEKPIRMVIEDARIAGAMRAAG